MPEAPYIERMSAPAGMAGMWPLAGMWGELSVSPAQKACSLPTPSLLPPGSGASSSSQRMQNLVKWKIRCIE